MILRKIPPMRVSQEQFEQKIKGAAASILDGGYRTPGYHIEMVIAACWPTRQHYDGDGPNNYDLDDTLHDEIGLLIANQVVTLLRQKYARRKRFFLLTPHDLGRAE